jgi:hypothetical protein
MGGRTVVARIFFLRFLASLNIKTNPIGPQCLCLVTAYYQIEKKKYSFTVAV